MAKDDVVGESIDQSLWDAAEEMASEHEPIVADMDEWERLHGQPDVDERVPSATPTPKP